MRRTSFPVLLLALALSAPALGAPAQVVIIRHGEKPATGNELDPQGWQRAQALVGFFETDPAVIRYGTPAAIYAMAPKGPDGTLRPIETVTPLAQHLGLTIDEDYTKKEMPQVVADIMGNPAYDGRMVLICWEHKAIPELVRDFGWTQGPDQWPGGDVYDRAWILNFTGDQVTSFQDIPEHVLPGDSAR